MDPHDELLEQKLTVNCGSTPADASRLLRPHLEPSDRFGTGILKEDVSAAESLWQIIFSPLAFAQ